MSTASDWRTGSSVKLKQHSIYIHKHCEVELKFLIITANLDSGISFSLLAKKKAKKGFV